MSFLANTESLHFYNIELSASFYNSPPLHYSVFFLCFCSHDMMEKWVKYKLLWDALLVSESTAQQALQTQSVEWEWLSFRFCCVSARTAQLFLLLTGRQQWFLAAAAVARVNRNWPAGFGAKWQNCLCVWESDLLLSGCSWLCYTCKSDGDKFYFVECHTMLLCRCVWG